MHVYDDGTFDLDAGDEELMAAHLSGLVKRNTSYAEHAERLWGLLSEREQGKLVANMSSRGMLSRDGYWDNFCRRVSGV